MGQMHSYEVETQILLHRGEREREIQYYLFKTFKYTWQNNYGLALGSLSLEACIMAVAEFLPGRFMLYLWMDQVGNVFPCSI